jgi:RNA polymerase sigma-70 factor, ECF subfamily
LDSTDQANDAEAAARAAWNRGDYSSAARCVFEAYNTELYGFLLAQFRGEAGPADDVFSQFGEDFWLSLPKFEWRCSARAWCYKLARSAASRYRRSPHNRVGRRVPLSAAPWLEELAAQARTVTRPHLRSELKDGVQLLREQLSRDDQDLLILRVDRGLSWRDIAHAMLASEEGDDAEPGGSSSDTRIAKAEVALRQRFAEIKKRLRKLAQEAGLV